MKAEEKRLEESRERKAHWKRSGPYLSERAWGTVREDYSTFGEAWDYLPHDQARSKAYRWNEDGLAGVSDQRQLICFALSLWNGRDPKLRRIKCPGPLSFMMELSQPMFRMTPGT